MALIALTEGLITELLPAAAGIGGVLAAQDSFCGGEKAEDYCGLLIGEAGLDDEAAELDFVPGIEPAIAVSDATHPNLIPPHQHPCAAQQLCGFCLGGERMRRRRATSLDAHRRSWKGRFGVRAGHRRGRHRRLQERR